ncbi:glycosyltransferase family 4 protein [Marinobacter sp. 1Y8]
MKVLIVNTADISGGAARAAFRLHLALLGEGVDSQMLAQDKQTDLLTVAGPAGRLQKLRAMSSAVIDSLPLRHYPERSKTLFSPAWAPSGTAVGRINALKPDVVHLHWINGGMLRIEDVAKIEAPVVWSLHDMWAFTGGCHYDEYCGRYTALCGHCPVLGSNRKADLSRRVLRRKLKAFGDKSELTVVGLSRWLTAAAAASSLFKDREIVHLPNPINTDSFSPFDKRQARELLNLPADKKLVLFGAMSATADPRKGFTELRGALGLIETDDVELVVFGSSGPAESQGFKQPVHYLGRLHDDAVLRALYSAADVVVAPSRQENLSNAIMESLACGTPVVAFDVGGNSDLVDHQLSGFLAKDGDVADLARGIHWVLNHHEKPALSAHAISAVKDRFDSKRIAKKYTDLYMDIINR